jgi:hypothetical protein
VISLSSPKAVNAEKRMDQGQGHWRGGNLAHDMDMDQIKTWFLLGRGERSLDAFISPSCQRYFVGAGCYPDKG